MPQHVRANGGDLSSLRVVPCGGSAVPHTLMEAYEKELGVYILQAWGMTETSPLGSVAHAPVSVTGEDAWKYRDTQGRLICEVEARLVGDGGVILAHDGEAVGEVQVRGPWITGAYYKDDDPDKFHDGWLRTGDVGTIDPLGYVVLTDRAKDVIKSGGEWISSMELENAIMAHPSVLEAAVIGVADDRWGERPLAAVVLAPGATTTAAELREFLSDRVPRWQLPERWSFISEVPKTSVGKFAKTKIRDSYARGEYEVIEAR
jgi:fatty-acyl-CoA synthase